MIDDAIKENMSLVYSIVNSFNPSNKTVKQDLIDVGRIALWKSLLTYDENKGKITTYAYRPIRWAIIRELKNKTKDKNISITSVLEPSYKEKEKLWEVVDSSLTVLQKEIIKLRMHGFKFDEICDLLNEDASIVKSNFYKTIKYLKKINE